jgi:NAD+ kinase
LSILRHHQVNFSCVNRVELDRQHLADVDLLVAVGGDGTVLSSAHFLDHGTIPLLGINSDPTISQEDKSVKKKSDERRSHGALCMCTALNMADGVAQVLHGGGSLGRRTRIQCTVKSTFSETRLVPALNDLLIANPSPAAVSRFRMGWLEPLVSDSDKPTPTSQYGTVTRFGGLPYDVVNSINVWSSGMWVCTATGSTAAMKAAGGKPMELESSDLQYLIREHMIESSAENGDMRDLDNRIFGTYDKMHLRWNSQKGRIFIDGSHLTHNLELGDEIVVDNGAPPLQMFERLDF